MGREVLVPFDGSEPSRGALGYALEEFPEAEVTLLYVLESHGQADRDPGGVSGVDREDVDRAAEEVTDAGRDLAAEHGVEATVEIVSGQPWRRIVEVAGESDCDLIVMGTHGRTGVERALLGSVAENVVRQAPVPVLVYR